MSVQRRYPVFRRVFGAVPGVRWLVGGIAAAAIAAAVVMRLLNPAEYPTYEVAFWWAIQTVTTIGYGDVTPKTLEGRTVASILMVAGVAAISLLTATISAALVERRRRAQQAEDPMMMMLARIEQRLEQLEQRLEG
jgi:voltage-gated potassium channel